MRAGARIGAGATPGEKSYAMASLSHVAGIAAGRLRWVAGAKSGSAAVVQTILGRVLLMGINVINGVYTARHFGPSGRGLLAALGMWPNLLCFVFTLGVPFAIRYHARKHQSDQNSLASAALVLAAILGVVAMLAGIAILPFIMKQYAPEEIRSAQELLAFAPVVMVTLILTSMLEVRFEFSFSNFTRYAPPFATFAGLLALSAAHALTPFHAALAYLVPSLLISIAMAVYLRDKYTFTLVGFKRSVRRLLGFGIRIYGSDVMSTFGQQIDQFLVIGLLTAADLGVYVIALQASRVLNIFQTSLGTVLLPKIAGLPTHQVVTMVTRVARLTTALTAASGVALIVVMPLLLPGLYGHGFHQAVAISQILVVESVLAASTGVLVQTFMATDRPGLATTLQMVGLGFAVPMMLLLIPRLGLVGAAIALLISTSARLTIAILCYPLLLKSPAPGLIVKAADLRYLYDALRGRRAAIAAED